MSDLQFLHYGSHLSVVSHLAILVAVLSYAVVPQPSDVAAEDTRDEDASAHFLLVIPLDLEHPPVGLDGDGCEAFFLSLLLSLTNSRQKTHTVSTQAFERAHKGSRNLVDATHTASQSL